MGTQATFEASEQRSAGHVDRIWETMNTYRILVGKKLSLGRPKRRMEDNINMGVRAVSYEASEWVELPQNCVKWRIFALPVAGCGVLGYDTV